MKWQAQAGRVPGSGGGVQKMDVSIIMPVWNKSNLTDSFLLQHAGRYAGRNDIEFVIVDNGSTDDTLDVINKWEAYLSNVRVISVEENAGFGGGNNIGARSASGKMLIFTQNDISVRGDYIGAMARRMHEYSDGNLYGAQLIRRSDSWNTFGGVVIEYLQGWMLGVWRQDWIALGGFDEAFYPCDYEDIDLSYRAVRAGWRLRETKVPVQHMFGGTTQSLDRLAITRKHKKIFAKKWGLLCT